MAFVQLGVVLPLLSLLLLLLLVAVFVLVVVSVFVPVLAVVVVVAVVLVEVQQGEEYRPSLWPWMVVELWMGVGYRPS